MQTNEAPLLRISLSRILQLSEGKAGGHLLFRRENWLRLANEGTARVKDKTGRILALEAELSKEKAKGIIMKEMLYESGRADTLNNQMRAFSAEKSRKCVEKAERQVADLESRPIMAKSDKRLYMAESERFRLSTDTTERRKALEEAQTIEAEAMVLYEEASEANPKDLLLATGRAELLMKCAGTPLNRAATPSWRINEDRLMGLIPDREKTIRVDGVLKPKYLNQYKSKEIVSTDSSSGDEVEEESTSKVPAPKKRRMRRKDYEVSVNP